MNRDDAHTSHNHGFELPELPQAEARGDSRRWRAVAGVALCLALAGIVTGLIVAHRQSVSDEHLTSDALQREDLRDGWKALGAAAALEAQGNDARADIAKSSAAPSPNVVIVNVPAASAPPNVTNINLPSGSSLSPDAAHTSANTNRGYDPTQSMPPINFSPVPGYLPVPTPPADSATPASPAPATSYLPPNVYAPSPAGSAPFTPAIGNGSIPGSVSNPALPNTGLVGAVPTPNSGSTPSLPSSP